MELEEAQRRILAVIPPAQPEQIPLSDCYGRILAEAIVSSCDLPAFDNSAMDGYAVRAADVESASATNPVRLRLRARIPAGETFSGELAPGECARLFTGSPLPAGADAVVMQEDTHADPENADGVIMTDGAKPYENVRLRGEDVKRGTLLANAGEWMSAGKISLLAASGVTRISAGKRPSVAMLATGSELREGGQLLATGQIYESNRLTLSALARRAGALPRAFPLVPDNLSDTRHALDEAFQQADIVVTSGGVSVGEMDFVKAAFEEIGGQLEFWKVAIRPGRPFVFGRFGGKLLFGLPGNPVSAFVTFLLLVRPALLLSQGATERDLPTHPGVLAEPIANPGERRHFVRVRIDATGKVFSAGLQASHALFSLGTANGLVEVKPRTTLAEGTTVSILRWE